MTPFRKKLNKALKDPMLGTIPLSVRMYEEADAKEILHESQKPQAGIYYWVPTPNGEWHLMSFWAEFYGNMAHAQIWKSYLAKELATTFKSNKAEELEKYPYGLPRGRIFVTVKGIQLWHGGDTPTPDGSKKVLDDFNLSKENTEIIEHPHEKPKETQVEKIKEILSI